MVVQSRQVTEHRRTSYRGSGTCAFWRAAPARARWTTPLPVMRRCWLKNRIPPLHLSIWGSPGPRAVTSAAPAWSNLGNAYQDLLGLDDELAAHTAIYDQYERQLAEKSNEKRQQAMLAARSRRTRAGAGGVMKAHGPRLHYEYTPKAERAGEEEQEEF